MDHLVDDDSCACGALTENLEIREMTDIDLACRLILLSIMINV